MRFRFIEDHRSAFLVRVMCAVLEVSASGYYAWRSRPESARAGSNRALVDAIRRVHADSRRRYGNPRVHAVLRAEGSRVGRNRIARLMRRHGLRARCRRRFRTTTDSNHALPLAPNLLARQFTAPAPNRAWLADITYVPIVDDVNGSAALGAPPTRQGQQEGAAEISLDVLVMDAQPQPMTDQATGHGVEDMAAREAGRGGHPDGHLLPGHGRCRWQGAQRGALGIDRRGVAAIVLSDHLGDEGAIVVEPVERTGAAQQERLGDACLDVAVPALDGAVLVRDAAIVAGRRHPVVEDERLVAAGQIQGIRLGQVAEGGREAVATMLARRAAEQAQGVRQTVRQGRIALAAEHDLGMLEAGMGEREMIQPMGAKVNVGG